MKEASGEANITIITILLIAIVGVVGTVLINNLMNSTKERSCCTEAGGKWSGGTCTDGGNSYYDSKTYENCKNGNTTGTGTGTGTATN